MKNLYTIGLVLSIIFVNSTAYAQYAYDYDETSTESIMSLSKTDKAALMANPEYVSAKKIQKDGTTYFLIGLGIQLVCVTPAVGNMVERTYYMPEFLWLGAIGGFVAGFVLEGIGIVKWIKGGDIIYEIKMKNYGTSVGITYNF